mmetsp:Transcript_38870/g.91508  ORF Transcript_38870/g.91508 Transcript_38870/m.91508 type:complete len:260 (+) Transcript_38870:546-1325(+)
MSGVSTLQNCGKLRIADSSLLPGSANAARANADLDNVSPTEDQLLCHFLGHDVACHNGVGGEPLTKVADALNKCLRVAICNINADHLHGWYCLQNLRQLLDILLQDAHASCHVRKHILALAGCPPSPLLCSVVLVDGGEALSRGKHLSYLECAHHVHIGGNHGDTVDLMSRVLELVVTLERDLGSASNRRPLGSDENILEVQLHVHFYARHGWKSEARRGKLSARSQQAQAFLRLSRKLRTMLDRTDALFAPTCTKRSG